MPFCGTNIPKFFGCEFWTEPSNFGQQKTEKLPTLVAKKVKSDFKLAAKLWKGYNLGFEPDCLLRIVPKRCEAINHPMKTVFISMGLCKKERRGNFSVLAMELCLYCTNPSIWYILMCEGWYSDGCYICICLASNMSWIRFTLIHSFKPGQTDAHFMNDITGNCRFIVLLPCQHWLR